MSSSPSAPPLGTPSPRPWHDDPTLCLRERLAGAPTDGLVKGWLFQSVVENAKRHGVQVATPQRWLGFKDYPVREYLELLAQAAVRVQPEWSARDTLRLLGRGVYGSFSASLFGKVILAGLGGGHDGARTGLRWITHVYKLTSNHALASFTEPVENVAVIKLSSVWSFPDAYHVGIFEGAAQAFGGDVAVEVASQGLSEATLTFTWKG